MVFPGLGVDYTAFSFSVNNPGHFQPSEFHRMPCLVGAEGLGLAPPQYGTHTPLHLLLLHLLTASIHPSIHPTILRREINPIYFESLGSREVGETCGARRPLSGLIYIIDARTCINHCPLCETRTCLSSSAVRLSSCRYYRGPLQHCNLHNERYQVLNTK